MRIIPIRDIFSITVCSRLIGPFSSLILVEVA